MVVVRYPSVDESELAVVAVGAGSETAGVEVLATRNVSKARTIPSSKRRWLKVPLHDLQGHFVGEGGLEPPASCSQSRHRGSAQNVNMRVTRVFFARW